MTARELREQLSYCHDNDDVYVMVTIEKPSREEFDRLDLDYRESHSKMHITSVTHDQFHCTLHIPRIVI
jgi:hypothetical protein